jgi:hypothetical protein
MVGRVSRVSRIITASTVREILRATEPRGLVTLCRTSGIAAYTMHTVRRQIRGGHVRTPCIDHISTHYLVLCVDGVVV